jgi:hypothetical protein
MQGKNGIDGRWADATDLAGPGSNSTSLGSRIRSQAGYLSSQVQGHCRRWIGKLRQAGSVVRTLLLAGAGIVVATACLARSRVASAAVQLFQGGKALLSRAGQAVARWLPTLGWCGI